MRVRAALCLCGSLIAWGILSGQDKWTTLAEPSVIQSVTVYQNRAMVVRSLSRDFSPGFYVLKLPDLPAPLLEDSVRASGRGTAAAKILDIRVMKEFVTEGGQAALKDLEKRIQDVDNEIQAVNDRLEVLSKKADFIKALSSPKPPEEKGQPLKLASGAAEWAGILNFVDSQLTQVLGQVRRLNLDKKELEKKRNALQYEMNQQASLQNRERKTILVEMEVTRAGSEKVDVSYVVPGISWIPTYDLRLSSTKTEAFLTCQALVKQETGEDWTDVQLSLSTASPALSKQAPKIQPWVVNTPDSELGALLCLVLDGEGTLLPGAIVTLSGGNAVRTSESDVDGRAVFFNLQPGSYDLRASLPGFQVSVQNGIDIRAGRTARINAVLGMAELNEEVAVKAQVKYEELRAAAPAVGGESKDEEMEAETAEAIDRAVSAVFSLKGKQSIPSSSEQKKVTLAMESLPAEKVYLAVPKLAETVFLTANLENVSGFPLLPGKASLFYDEDYISTAMVPQVVSGERFTVNVGEISGIKVKWQLVNKARSESGLIGKKVRIAYETKITVENLLGSAQTLLVKDQIPVTTSKNVTIELLQAVPSPRQGKDETDARNGILSWSIDLQPKEKKEILLKFQITHPKGSPLFDSTD